MGAIRWAFHAERTGAPAQNRRLRMPRRAQMLRLSEFGHPALQPHAKTDFVGMTWLAGQCAKRIGPAMGK
jgi:hypothetical protein